ncbi:unnamed protein product [Mucor hiemalis]
MQYESDKKVFGLKVDLRFVVTLSGIDLDIGALEADIVDGLLNSIHDITDIREISGAGIQVGEAKKIDMEYLAFMALKSDEFFKDRRRSFGKNFNATSANQFELDYIHWIASSWYPPVNNSRRDSQIPVEETASPPSPLFTTSNNTEVEYDPELVLCTMYL